MKEGSPLRVSVTGPDGAGKDTAWRMVKPHLPPELRVVKIGKPSSVILDGRERPVHVPVSRTLDWVHEWADHKRSRRLTALSNTAYVLFQWRAQEAWLTSQVQPDLVFSLRDGYADPAAYAPYYTTGTLGRLEIPDRIDMLHTLHGSPLRDHTIFLDIEPAVAIQRIAERLERERNMTKKPMREKWVHLHENESDLAEIREEFFDVLSHLRERGTQTDKIDTTPLSREAVGERLTHKILTIVQK